MRVISGKYGGRKLSAFDAAHLRPTTDRVKESIFNKLMPYLPCERALDLFSGTGNLAIEALSRDVSFVTSVEMNKKSLKIMSQNRQLLKIQDEWQVLSLDVLKFLKNYEGQPYQLILIDPPFTQKMAHECMENVAKSRVFSKDSIVVIESSSQERIEDNYPPFLLLDRRNFGDKFVSFFKISEGD